MNNYKELAQTYEGKPLNTQRFAALFRSNGKGPVYAEPGNYSDFEMYDEYIAYCPSFDKATRDLFGITPRLYEYWEYYGIDFRVYVHHRANIIKQCSVFKYKETYGGHGRSCGHKLKPTQQELRIFRRIMDYVTE